MSVKFKAAVHDCRQVDTMTDQDLLKWLIGSVVKQFKKNIDF